ncbi:MAG: MarR family transcriptional regulator [Rhizobiaceae bacterium]|nr:MarR family transcriptional regulator [Rhizobiaceae bacterium]
MTEKMTNLSPEQQVYFRFFNEVGIINQLSSTRAERNLPHGLTMSQYSVLNHFVRGLPPKSPLELANAFQVTKGAMTNTLKQLHKKGFVEIRPHEVDGRSKIVSISEAGRSAHQDALQVLGAAFADFIKSFEPQELADLIPMLEKVRIWLDENR